MKKKLVKTLLSMTACTVCSFIAGLLSTTVLTAANSTAQKVTEVVIAVNLENATIPETFAEIEAKTEFIFLYNRSVVEAIGKRVTLHHSAATVEEVLVDISAQTGASFRQQGRTIATDFPVNSESTPVVIEQEIITGRVFDANTEEPIPGVNVVVEGTTTGTTTDPDGFFELSLPDLQRVLVISFIGYETQTVPIDGRTSFDIGLEPAIMELDEFVVIGYGTQRKSDLTGSVSSIEGGVISGQAITDVDQVIQGRVPGVQVVASSGEPGSPMQVRIRGMSSFGDNSPLYVIDGISVKEDDLNILNPNDIVSIEILKDASAAAIYGARAANGVVLITTSSGHEGEMELRYNGYYGVQSFNNFIPLLNSQQYADLNNEVNAKAGLPLESWANNPDILQVNTDWQRAAFQTAPMQNHNISASGGDATKTFFVSGEYLNQEGIMVFSNMQRYSARINTRFNIGDHFTIGESLTISHIEGLNRGQGSDLDFSYMFGASPTIPLYNDNNLGGYGGPAARYAGDNNRDNVVGRRDLRRTTSENTRILGNAFAEIELLPELIFRLNLGLNAGLESTRSFLPVFEMDNRSNRVASLSESSNRSNEFLIENLLRYETNVNDIFDISVLAGYTQQSSDFRSISASVREFPSNNQPVLSAGTGQKNVGGNRTEWALRSFLGRINATILDRYLVSATIRRDGSSRFGAENRYGNFPSFALGWIISREDFMSDYPLFFKVRGSWGQLGNQEIDNYASQAVINTNLSYVFGRNREIATGGAVTSMGNPFLKWETTTQSNIGFELGLLEDRLQFEFDYYQKTTEDLLLRVPVSMALGVGRNNGPYQNAGGIKNYGFETMVSYSDRVNDLGYRLSVNLSTVNNEVTSLGGESSIIHLVDNSYFYGTYTYNQVGLPMSNFYGWVYDGIFQNQAEIDAHATQPGAEPGDIRFKDINGDGIVDAEDRTIIGSPLPDLTFGISASGSYRNFDLSLMFVGVQGIDLYNANRAYLESMLGDMNQSTAVLGRWQGEGTSYTMPRATRSDPNRNTRPSSRYVEDASYIRLQNLQLGYNLPANLVNQIGIQNLKVYLNAQNLFTLTGYSGYNPEVIGDEPGISSGGLGFPSPLAIGVDSGTYPLARTIQLGLDIRF